MKPIRQNFNTFVFLPNKREEKLKLIESKKAQQISISIDLKSDAEIYTYMKGSKIYGFCVINPSTEIRWHYQFKTMEKLQSFAQFVVMSHLKAKLFKMLKEHSRSTNK